MSSCAIETCERSNQRGGSGCDMCDRVAMLPQQKPRESMRVKNATRDGMFDQLAKSHDPTFKARKRVGPHR